MSSLTEWRDLILEIRGPHPEDDPKTQNFLMNVALKEELFKNSKHYKDNFIKGLAKDILENPDLNWLDIDETGWGMPFAHMRKALEGEEYECAQCNKKFKKRKAVKADEADLLSTAEKIMIDDDDDEDDDEKLKELWNIGDPKEPRHLYLENEEEDVIEHYEMFMINGKIVKKLVEIISMDNNDDEKEKKSAKKKY